MPKPDKSPSTDMKGFLDKLLVPEKEVISRAQAEGITIVPGTLRPYDKGVTFESFASFETFATLHP